MELQLTELTRQVRLVCESALSLADLLLSADEFVANAVPSPDLCSRLDQELQSVYDDAVDHSPSHIQVFLALLSHFKQLLIPSSIVSSWFDLVLRPALRLPKLSTTGVSQARELVLLALCSDDDASQKKVVEFRARLLDLYLLDTFNEGSGEDVIEWVDLNPSEREKRSFWKSNLEEILVGFGEARPVDLYDSVNHHFGEPASRLQLLTFMNIFISPPSFTPSAAFALSNHELMNNIILSLIIDNSTIACTVALTAVTKLLPIYAVHSPEVLRGMIHQLFAVLARILCWKQRLVFPSTDPEHSITEIEGWEHELREPDTKPTVPLRQGVDWRSLELTFDGKSLPPNPRTYFTFLYYLFPSNVFKFLRDPVGYFAGCPFESPFEVDWDRVLIETKIRTLSEYLFRRHIFHPMMLWQDAEEELAGKYFWAEFDVARIATEASMLDIRNMSRALRERLREDMHKAPGQSNEHHHASPPQLLIQNMIETASLLKSSTNIEVIRTIPHWSGFNDIVDADKTPDEESEPSVQNIPQFNSVVSSGDETTLAYLQLQVLSLRTELNFELWLARENVKHIGRLYQDRVSTQNAEVERQGLYNKLRNYRGQVVRLESELRENKEQALTAKNKYVDWNNELQKKLRELRDEKKAWIVEAAQLRSESAKAADLFAAQGRLLSDATHQVFRLETQKKETQHKIDRLHDYETQIEQHMKMQTLWSEDFARFNEQGNELELARARNRQLEEQLKSVEETRRGLERENEVHRRQVQALEHLSPRLSPRRHPYSEHRRYQRSTDITEEAYQTLREQNFDLREEVEELRAMVEVLRGQVENRRGLVPEPRTVPSSPLLSSIG